MSVDVVVWYYDGLCGRLDRMLLLDSVAVVFLTAPRPVTAKVTHSVVEVII